MQHPIRFPRTWAPGDPRISERLESILEPWRGTPYLSGQRVRGSGADCVGFATAVLDELDGRPRGPVADVPADASLHSPSTSWRAVARIRRRYRPCAFWKGQEVEPGDVLVVGVSGGGPGHIALVGPRRNTIWHCCHPFGVIQAGWALQQGAYDQLFAVYRILDRERWLR